MSIRHWLLPAITILFFFKVAVAQDKTGYEVLTNAGNVSVSVTVETRSDDEAEQANVYRDKLIIEDTNSMEDVSGESSGTEYGK